jgi:hypothetical protein
MKGKTETPNICLRCKNLVCGEYPELYDGVWIFECMMTHKRANRWNLDENNRRKGENENAFRELLDSCTLSPDERLLLLESWEKEYLVDMTPFPVYIK